MYVRTPGSDLGRYLKVGVVWGIKREYFFSNLKSVLGNVVWGLKKAQKKIEMA